jgi:hypothetical protein
MIYARVLNGGRAGCEVVIWRHFDGATDETRSNRRLPTAVLARPRCRTYVHTIHRDVVYARVRWAVSLVKERTAVLNAGGGEGCREKAPAGLRVDDCRPFSRRCEYSFIQRQPCAFAYRLALKRTRSVMSTSARRTTRRAARNPWSECGSEVSSEGGLEGVVHVFPRRAAIALLLLRDAPGSLSGTRTLGRRE